jgi:methylmalonyl-CoA/ethylmalonyl-CoA epimerase
MDRLTGGRVDHVGVVVRDTVAAIALYQQLFALRVVSGGESSGEGVRLTFLEPTNPASGGSSIELLEPTRSDTGVARFLERRGEGMHHICFEVESVAAEIERLGASGFQVLDTMPRSGIHGERLAFLHPKSVMGVLIELYERGSRQAVRH